MIFATQREAHIHDSNVLDALKNVAIQCVTKQPHVYEYGGEAIEIKVSRVDLSRKPQVHYRPRMGEHFNVPADRSQQKDSETRPNKAAIKPPDTDETDAQPY